MGFFFQNVLEIQSVETNMTNTELFYIEFKSNNFGV